MSSIPPSNASTSAPHSASPTPQSGASAGAAGAVHRDAIIGIVLAVVAVIGLILPLFFGYIWPYLGLVASGWGFSKGGQAFNAAKQGAAGQKVIALVGMILPGLVMLLSLGILIYVIIVK